MGILVALIGVAIIAAVVVASFTAVLGGVIGGELEDEDNVTAPPQKVVNPISIIRRVFHSHLFIILQTFLLTYP